MKRNFIFLFSTITLVVFGINFNHKINAEDIIIRWSPDKNVIEMPILGNKYPLKTEFENLRPLEQRGEEFKEFLAASLKISVGGASGSGTICYYDQITNYAYVISCGHLWSGNHDYKESKIYKKAKVITWYHNDTKLQKPTSYEAEILFWSNTRGYDASLLRFQPDWEPNYFPIAVIDHNITKGQILNSLGCDGAGEVARYEVKFLEYRGVDLITEKNSPRPGRSGGGLITDSGWYVGICWGTSDTTSGNGIGYFTPLKSIHDVFKKNQHEWLLDIGRFSNKNIPIIDRQNSNRKYNWDFVPIPILNF
jgi:hypothetical protein